MYNDLMINGKWNSEILKKERWLYYLAITKNNAINCERVDSIASITGLETLNYVLRTLKVLERIKDNLTEREYFIIKRVLQWSEVAKGGTEKQRAEWLAKGYPLDIHNLASAEIYLEESTDSVADTKLIYLLIKTHGIIGQNIRGEVDITKNMPLRELYFYVDRMHKNDIFISGLLVRLNECILEGVSRELLDFIYDEMDEIVTMIDENRIVNFTTEDRLHRLLPRIKNILPKTRKLFESQVFPFFELWYFTSALETFSEEQILSLMKLILKTEGLQRITHLNFKPLADNLHYDYEGKKHINVYKQRVIEKYLKNPTSVENVSLKVTIQNNTLLVDFEFSPACLKLIDFCVEAERSGLLTYEKSIKVLFDMFGFRRDKYDRLNNEDKYLATMNDATSTKKSIVDYVVGDKIVDVGSGGGVMLDLLEERFPDKEIIGTDISTNVLEVLNDKKNKEGHSWNTMLHNFVEGPLPEKVDTIIFSSILHEIFSYTDLGKGRFDVHSVMNALQNAYNSLNEGGRIVIRDGVRTDSEKELTMVLKTDEAVEFLRNFCNDFEGMPYYRDTVKIGEKDENGYTVKGNVNYLREFMYTYTWGNESYSHEVQEQFGYATLESISMLLEAYGSDIVEAKEFLEDGYYEHLKETIILPKEEYPASNYILVATKNKAGNAGNADNETLNED